MRKSRGNCLDCQFHCVLPDPDPDDSFNDDDQMVVCTRLKSATTGESEVITSACRPYNKRKECETPDWCPLWPWVKPKYTIYTNTIPRIEKSHDTIIRYCPIYGKNIAFITFDNLD